MTARLDTALVQHGIAESRSRAQLLIAEGVVLVDGILTTKPATKVAEGAALTLTHNPIPWVSRAALKLIHAIDHFNISIQGTCLDLGASTGGFTEVLLARGALHVYAVDVGRNQLHASLRENTKVTVMEGQDARDLTDLPPIDLFVADASFISLTKLLPTPLSFAATGAVAVLLIKPQFELSPKDVGKGGLVREQSAAFALHYNRSAGRPLMRSVAP